MVQGITQINVQLPDGVTGTAVPLEFQVGGQWSQSGVVIAIQGGVVQPLLRRGIVK